MSGARAIVLAALMFPAPLAADEIGGDWCAGDGRSIRIEHARVRSPGGQWTDGEYDRHDYAFVIPDGEADAGLRVEMAQMSEQAVRVRYAGREAENWGRCQFTS